MSRVSCFDLAEAAWYLSRGLKLERVNLLSSQVITRRSLVELVFAGENARELALECLASGPWVELGDLARLGEPLAAALEKAGVR